MIKKLYKIPEKIIFKSIFLIAILWSIKYLFLPIQVPFTMITQDYIYKNNFYSEVLKIKTETQKISDFQDFGFVGFLSDTNQNEVFDLQTSIKNFYITQYAIIPSILKNDTDKDYVIAVFEKKAFVPKNFTIAKKINENLYILKRITND